MSIFLRIPCKRKGGKPLLNYFKKYFKLYLNIQAVLRHFWFLPDPPKSSIIIHQRHEIRNILRLILTKLIFTNDVMWQIQMKSGQMSVTVNGYEYHTKKRSSDTLMSLMPFSYWTSQVSLSQLSVPWCWRNGNTRNQDSTHEVSMI